MNPARIFGLTALAMVAFASNSILCRAALKQTSIDAATFTSIRLFSGAALLWLLLQMRSTRQTPAGNWWSATSLFIYAAAFSFAYKTLSAGTGALLLFAAVQATMISWGFRRGETLKPIQIAGLTGALAGLVILIFPGLSAPPIGGSILMAGAGMAWGIYSLRGKGEKNPIGATAGNFIRAVPMALLVSLATFRSAVLDPAGVALAVVSGAITSGLGYVIWYIALPGLKATGAATVQLSVPVLAATGGILLLSEPPTLRYLIASIAVLGGIALVVVERRSVR